MNVLVHVGAGFPDLIQASAGWGVVFQGRKQASLDDFVHFKLFAAIVHDLEIVGDIGVRRDFDTHDDHFFAQKICKVLAFVFVVLSLEKTFDDIKIAAQGSGAFCIIEYGGGIGSKQCLQR